MQDLTPSRLLELLADAGLPFDPLELTVEAACERRAPGAAAPQRQ